MEIIKQRITPFLWFNTQAEEAAHFYANIFKDSAIKSIVRYGDTGPGPKGTVMTVSFQLDGQEFVALNGGPHFKFTEAISLVVNCSTQDEVDEFWEKLSAGGEKSQCGWLKDKFGLSWQVVPIDFIAMVQDANPKKADKVMQAMMKMQKLELAVLKQAYES